ncbi:MAG: hypothetical protein A3F84_17115 [Candidatus Handelsmanbacteria bacterium RIFCSPLOWO2_12_FULL_64_10]|uniref:RidA family protein n=1 Tax=Handelsmanbacteria sp. (strain RIFCSPLOWO2_12_FULL_64_10) TaxID=1817868 RepID=A0A1F6C9P5_HANXR|nr:MAG: hypothetical protein A3F84_17115 [Candidatus Handelsmanbacteria bacterium RIFCSPLOWO2_12_FULL_64_10]
MTLTDNPRGNYLFLPGISPYSCGVVAAPGYEVVHVTLSRLLPYRRGFEVISGYLDRLKRPRHALCAVELRSPAPFTFEGFAQFNRGYREILEDWGLLTDGVNPVARTNVAPEVGPPAEPALHAFSCTVPSAEEGPTFVVAGAGEVREGRLETSAIVREGETSAEALTEKAAYVMERMSGRLGGLGVSWAGATAVGVYTAHDLFPFLRSHILSPASHAARHGIRWYLARPPVVGIEFEMDVRGVREERVLQA